MSLRNRNGRLIYEPQITIAGIIEFYPFEIETEPLSDVFIFIMNYSDKVVLRHICG